MFAEKEDMSAIFVSFIVSFKGSSKWEKVGSLFLDKRAIKSFGLGTFLGSVLTILLFSADQ